jgi:hypothetical protein
MTRPFDHEAVIDAVGRLHAGSADGHAQVVRYAGRFLAWCAAKGMDPARLDLRGPEVELFEADPHVDMPVRKRSWAAHKAIEAAHAVAPPGRAPVAGTFGSRVATVSPRSHLGKAINAVLGQAPSERDRGIWRTLVGRFLAWCDVVGRAPEDTWDGDLIAYQRYLVADGVKATGPYRAVAGKLLRLVSES